MTQQQGYTKQAKQEVTLEQALQIAEDFSQQGNFPLAERTYREILQAIPGDFFAHHGMGAVRLRQGDFDGALQWLEKAQAINPADTACRNNIAIALASLGRMEEAVARWREVLHETPGYVDGHSNLSFGLKSLGLLEEAVAAADAALGLDPAHVDAWLNRGAALQEAGRCDEARAAWEKVLELDPRNSRACSNLAQAMRAAGKQAEGEALARRAIEYNPNNHEAYNNLGTILMDQMRHAEAEQALRRAVTLNPRDARTQVNLAQVLIQQWRLDEALAVARTAVAFEPKRPWAQAMLGVALMENGRLDEAELCIRKALELDDADASFYMELASILLMRDRLAEAEEMITKAMALKPDMPGPVMNLARLLERLNRFGEAIEKLEELRLRFPDMPGLRLQLAGLYNTENRADMSLRLLEDMTAAYPDQPELRIMQADAHMSLGNMEEARRICEDVLAKHPDAATAYYTLARIRKIQPGEPVLAQMDALAKRVDGMGNYAASCFYFGYAKALEDVGEHEKSFIMLGRGNDLKRQIVVYDRATQDRYFQKQKRVFSKFFMEASAGWEGCSSDIPIFIVGMPRSGSTLTEQILSAHPAVFGAGERYELQDVEKEFEELREDTCRAMGEAYVNKLLPLAPAGTRRITDKMPGNYMRLGLIARILPNARIIHSRRHPCDIALSCYKQNFAKGQYWSYNLEELAHEYRNYHDMMQYWHDLLPGRILEVDYEETVEDTEGVARRMLDHCGLEWDERVLEPHKAERSVLTASKAQVRQPIYKTSVKGWRRYEKELQPFIRALGLPVD